MLKGAPTFFLIEIETDHALSKWETLAEARASVAFSRINPDTFAVDVPIMTSLTS